MTTLVVVLLMRSNRSSLSDIKCNDAPYQEPRWTRLLEIFNPLLKSKFIATLFSKKNEFDQPFKNALFYNGKMIFSQNSPAVRFVSQRFRKSETKKKLMAAEFGVDLFFEPGAT